MAINGEQMLGILDPRCFVIVVNFNAFWCFLCNLRQMVYLICMPINSSINLLIGHNHIYPCCTMLPSSINLSTQQALGSEDQSAG